MDSVPIDQNRNQYIEVMGRPLGEVYYELWQELVWLYTKWGQYILLFDSAERVALLNKSAPTFFYIFQKSFLEDITLHIARMTDPAANKQGEKNLSFRQICCLVDQEKIPNEELTKLMKDLDTKTEFVKKWRHKKIAHRDLKFALSPSTYKLQKFSNAEVLGALQAMAKVLNLISSKYLSSSTLFDLAMDSIQGDASQLIHFLTLGIEFEDQKRKLDYAKDGF